MHAQATKEDIDVVICDTSGRLHTNVGLMEELAKCRRSIAKRLEGAPHETLLILDGTTGISLGFLCAIPQCFWRGMSWVLSHCILASRICCMTSIRHLCQSAVRTLLHNSAEFGVRLQVSTC